MNTHQTSPLSPRNALPAAELPTPAQQTRVPHPRNPPAAPPGCKRTRPGREKQRSKYKIYYLSALINYLEPRRREGVGREGLGGGGFYPGSSGEGLLLGLTSPLPPACACQWDDGGSPALSFASHPAYMEFSLTLILLAFNRAGLPPAVSPKIQPQEDAVPEALDPRAAPLHMQSGRPRARALAHGDPAPCLLAQGVVPTPIT